MASSLKPACIEPVMNRLQPLCRSHDLPEGGLAVPFDVNYAGQSCRAFAIRYKGLPQAYLNRCSHAAMELDWQPNEVFDDTGQWLVCASHGATFCPDTGQCVAGPGRGGLVKIVLSERDDIVYWHADGNLTPVQT